MGMYKGLDYYDMCYECTGYGDDYRFENGEWVSACDDCPYNRMEYDDDDW